MPKEIELKLRIREEDCPHLFQHPVLQRHAIEAPLTRRLTSMYFDTPDLQLLDAGISLRVRHMSGGWFQAVKAAGSSLAGLHQRMEWEDIIAGSDPDFSKITDPQVAGIFADNSLRTALRPLFVTDVDRTEWQLHMEGDVHVEVSLDAGELIIAQGGDWKQSSTRETIREVEIELKKGRPHVVFELAQALQADIPMVVENVSKAQRGYAYYRPIQLGINEFRPVPADPYLDTREVLKIVAWECLRQLQQNAQEPLLRNATLGSHAVAQIRESIDRLQATTHHLGWESLSTKLSAMTARFSQAAGPFLLASAVADEGQVELTAQIPDAVDRLLELLEESETQAVLLALGTALTA